MRTYEGMFLVEPMQASTNWSAVIGHIRQVLTKHKAKVINVSKWAERQLAYEIKKQKRGTYILIYFEAPSESIARIKAECQLSEIIMRVLILVLDQKQIQTLTTQPAS